MNSQYILSLLNQIGITDIPYIDTRVSEIKTYIESDTEYQKELCKSSCINMLYSETSEYKINQIKTILES